MLSRGTSIFFLIVFYWLAAAASFNGFYSKWGLRDDSTRSDPYAMIDQTAHRPFVYRQLLPAMARMVDATMPERVKGFVNYKFPINKWLKPVDGEKPGYEISYFALYYLTFLFLFLSLFGMRIFCRQAGMSDPASTFAPVIFALMFPVLLTKGGYFYDLSELFFMFAALCLVPYRRGRWLLIPLAIAATYNKESFLFFILALAVLYIRSLKDWAGIVIIGLSGLLSGGMHLLNVLSLQSAPGGNVENHILENIYFYLNPINLFKTTKTYGIQMTEAYGPILIALVVAFLIIGLPRLSPVLKRFSLACLVVNLPLFILFAAGGELRNLSFLYPTCVLLTAAVLDWQWNWGASAGRVRSPAGSGLPGGGSDA